MVRHLLDSELGGALASLPFAKVEFAEDRVERLLLGACLALAGGVLALERSDEIFLTCDASP